MSIIAISGSPNWSKITIPEGRTKNACQLLYYSTMKEFGVKSGNSSDDKKATSNGSPIGKRKSRGQEVKGKRGANDVDERPGKSQKTDSYVRESEEESKVKAKEV